jgi:hypothetical protein
MAVMVRESMVIEIRLACEAICMRSATCTVEWWAE